ncbi:MAG: ribbon-helix-helix protein, CopG family [Candidatus Njordarchaeales archaeon]
MKRVVSVRVDERLEDEIEKLSKLMNVKKSELIRAALILGLKEISSRVEEQKNC